MLEKNKNNSPVIRVNLFTIFGNNAKRLTDTNAIGLQYVCKGLTGVLRTLIGIEDIRLAIAIQGLFKRIYTKTAAHTD